jgi:hypothetical protein
MDQIGQKRTSMALSCIWFSLVQVDLSSSSLPLPSQSARPVAEGPAAHESHRNAALLSAQRCKKVCLESVGIASEGGDARHDGIAGLVNGNGPAHEHWSPRCKL